MLNQQTLQGNWNWIQGKLRNRWGQLTDDELQRFEGNVEQLVGMIQHKTGETQQAIEQYLDELAARGSAGLERGKAALSDYTHQAAEKARHTYEETEHLVQTHPLQSLALCFTTGLVTGLALGLMLRGR